jgi:ssDNA-binding Zn-finger/Zn-ribbon topoisomerase 1
MAIMGQFGNINDDSLANLRAVIGKEVRRGRPYIEELNADAIRHYSNGIGDQNPLFVDEDYARKSARGDLMAPRAPRPDPRPTVTTQDEPLIAGRRCVNCAYPTPDRLERCPECGFEGAEARSTKARGEFRKCLKCGNEWDVEAREEEAVAV